MHVGHARNAAYGDALARMLAFHGHPRRARVLRQRRRLAGAQARRIDPGARARRAARRGRLQGRLCERARRRARRTPRASTPATLGRARRWRSWSSRSSARSRPSAWASSTSGRMRARCTKAIPARSSTRWRSSSEQGHTYTQRGRAVAAHDGVRRRQGPRARALERRAHLLRLRHRLPPGQARAWLRAPDRRVGRRPPRLRAAHEGRL